MRKGSFKQAIFDYIKDNPGSTIRQISSALHTGYTYTATLAKQLYEEGCVNYNLDDNRYKHFILGTCEISTLPAKKPITSILTKIDDDALIEEIRRRGYKGEIAKSKTYNL